MIHEANGARFTVKDDMIVKWERQNSLRFESETAEFVFAERGVFLDIGASTGWYSVPMALRDNEVHAVEPLPASADRLEQNLLMNGAGAILYRAAASDMEGEAVLCHNRNLPLTSGASISPGGCIVPSGRLTVRTITVDGLGLAPRIMKVDVEGHEMAVLRGAEATIAAHRPLLVLEANTDAHRETLAGWLAERGYQWQRADDRNMLCRPS